MAEQHELCTDLLDGVAALDGPGGAGRGGLAASTTDVELDGSGGCKEGHGDEGKGSDAGEHVGFW